MPIFTVQIDQQLHLAGDRSEFTATIVSHHPQKAFDPIVELEQAKREIGGEGEGNAIGVQTVGDWWNEGGMGVIDVGETAVVRVGNTGPRLSEDPRRAVER